MKRFLSLALLISIVAPLAGCVVHSTPSGGYYRSSARTAPVRDHRR